MTYKLPHLKDFDAPVKVLFTGYLTAVAVGYFFAVVQIMFTHGMADGEFGLSLDDIVYSYYGNRSGTVLESKLNGSMKDNATEHERFVIMQWDREGGNESDYASTGVKKIIETKCVMCHNEGASGIPDFTKFEELHELTKEDEGATFASLTRVSHIHLFGISFIFMFVGLIFNFAETSTNKYKCIAIGMPYTFLIVDIFSWWLTKLHPMFASLIMLAGGGMAIAFIFMWVVSLLEMWFFEKAFVNAEGKRHPLWSTYVESKLQKIGCDDATTLLKKLGCFSRKTLYLLWKKWLELGLPFVKKILEKNN
ncbi:MAG: hypothetical protein KAH20_02220 [Methylococcales bacterium]|nr:hypothetical protein [Methylococcales bacterium]